MDLDRMHPSCVCSQLGTESRERPPRGAFPATSRALPACDARALSPMGTSVPLLTVHPQCEVHSSGSTSTGTLGEGEGQPGLCHEVMFRLLFHFF